VYIWISNDNNKNDVLTQSLNVDYLMPF